MSNLIVVGFDNAADAFQMRGALAQMQAQYLIEMEDAVVVTRDGVTGEALRTWCAERLSDYKVPETIVLTREPLPRNANGKVMKRQLREGLGQI